MQRKKDWEKFFFQTQLTINHGTMEDEKPKIVCFGCGVDSVANILLMQKKRIKPDHIIFADTGGEKKQTYEYLEYFNEYLKSIDYPQIVTVRYKTKDGKVLTLQEDIMNNKTSPGIVFGYKSCSEKFKIRPVEKYIKHVLGISSWINYVGFNHDEKRRMRENDNKNVENVFLLIENQITRKGCIELIKESGLRVPIKSACFFCPSSKKWEVLNLSGEEKAEVKKIEANATNVMEVKGLGRSYSWTELIEMDESQFSLLDDLELTDRPCECVD
jgi:hypothetical protein